MLTINTILEEIKAVPVDRLEEVYNYVHSLATGSTKSKDKKKASKNNRNEILSYAGILSDMSDSDYKDFQDELKRSRASTFDRDIDI